MKRTVLADTLLFALILMIIAYTFGNQLSHIVDKLMVWGLR